jgi:Holliday junction resolvasome RuvABC endonuclease subunit
MLDLVLGLDLSTTASGLVVVAPDPGSRLVKPVGAITIKRRGAAGSEALCVMAEAVRDFSRSWPATALEVVALEDVFAPPLRRKEGETEAQSQMRAARQRQIAIELARLGGMVEYLLWRRGLRVQRWMPAAWRSKVLGKNMAKLGVPLALYKRYAVEFPDEHQAMAFGVAAATLLFSEGGSDDPRRAQPAGAGPDAAPAQARLL